MVRLKRFLAIILALIMALGIVSCANNAPPLSDAVTSSSEKQDIPPTDNSNKQENLEMEDILKSKIKLRFNKDGEFKVIIFADLHLKAAGISETNEERIEALLEREKPDLVILTGDQIHDKSVSNVTVFEDTIAQVAEILEHEEIPWMHVYGNHDADGGLSKEQQQAVYESYDYCLSKGGDEELTGVGNYVIPLYSSTSDDIKFAFWGLDSGSNMSAKDKAELCPTTSTFGGYNGTGYDYIHEDQIEWYYNTSKQLEEYNNGQKVPGLMAFHIPLQETWTAWQNREALGYTGEKRDPICASAYNSGLFGVVRNRGDIKAIINGHDHINDFMVNYGGVMLCYSPSFSDSAYGAADLQGSRVFVIKESNPSNLETYVSYIVERDAPEVAGPLPTGYTYDFEGNAPTFILTGWNGATTAEADVSNIKAEIVSGKGLDGSKALAVTRKVYNSTKGGQNLEVKWELDTPGTLGENKYFLVWMDLATNDLDFRKAGFGLYANNINASPFRTDDLDTPCTFYYKADGSDTWVKKSTGADGCIGSGDGCSVAGYKGWFAFPIEYMVNSGKTQLTENSVIVGVYFYMSLANQNMVGKYVYLDNVKLVKDYTAY